MMTYREAGYIGAEPSFAECLNLASGGDSVVEGSLETVRKTSPSHSGISERGTGDSNYKREECMAESARSSLSGQSDNCNSPPIGQTISTSDSSIQVCRPNVYNVREYQVSSIGHNFDERQHSMYNKNFVTNNENKIDFFQSHNTTNNVRKYFSYKHDGVYDGTLSYPDSFGNTNGYDVRASAGSNNRIDMMNSSLYNHHAPYQSNDLLYGSVNAPEGDPPPGGFIGKNSFNDYAAHQVVNSPNLYPGNGAMQCSSKELRGGMCQDYSWMQNKKLNKKAHDSRRKFYKNKEFLVEMY